MQLLPLFNKSKVLALCLFTLALSCSKPSSIPAGYYNQEDLLERYNLDVVFTHKYSLDDSETRRALIVLVDSNRSEYRFLMTSDYSGGWHLLSIPHVDSVHRISSTLTREYIAFDDSTWFEPFTFKVIRDYTVEFDEGQGIGYGILFRPEYRDVFTLENTPRSPESDKIFQSWYLSGDELIDLNCDSIYRTDVQSIYCVQFHDEE
ncbi:hypothetical protein [Phaeocystidibacter luteus]|uniref:Lipoprotein n=1 Tax=Phaeocystidibacter luteus TaxID=911197 RepID=A0A6N6RKA8_9FLAO|nr:hypothetical protein [Phaeocystidibacter luteus]KAB2809821.1 hypothetical protein F8C67_09720 [Phaeocystidibacter luteus]